MKRVYIQLTPDQAVALKIYAAKRSTTVRALAEEAFRASYPELFVNPKKKGEKK